MPGLKEILRITPYETKTQKDLRANCIQTIGSILESVKEQPQVCKNDALEVMECFSKLIQPGVLNEDDPQIITIQGALAQLAGVLKEDFAPFLKPVVESLMVDVKKDVDMKIVRAKEAELEDNDSDQEDSKIQKMVMQIKGMEGPMQI